MEILMIDKKSGNYPVSLKIGKYGKWVVQTTVNEWVLIIVGDFDQDGYPDIFGDYKKAIL